MPVEMAGLFKQERPFASSAIWACVVYSLVPFVGIVFVPFVFVLGVVGLRRGESTYRSMAAGVLVLMAQLVFWWLLYVVPKWNAIH